MIEDFEAQLVRLEGPPPQPAAELRSLDAEIARLNYTPSYGNKCGTFERREREDALADALGRPRYRRTY